MHCGKTFTPPLGIAYVKVAFMLTNIKLYILLVAVNIHY